MYCSKCGALNDDSGEFCTSCGNSLNRINTEVKDSQITQQQVNSNYGSQPIRNYDRVPSYMAWSIISTVVSLFLLNFLALPAGIVAIVFSSQVDTKLKSGDYDGAVRSSKNAKIWNWVATALEIISVILIILFIILIVIGFSEYRYYQY